RLQVPDKTAAIIDPFTPTAPVLNSPRERKESSPIPVSNRKAVEGSNRRVTEPTGSGQFTDSRRSQTEQDAPGDQSGQTSTLVDDNRPVDQASYWAMQAQIQLLMQTVERMESVEEGPPEYVSAYGSSR
ncbi:hypothetical protein AAF712_016215, partial [Marasmius tenuissimus]